MAEKRVGRGKAKTWRLVLKTSEPLSETWKAVLPAVPRSPMQCYLDSEGNQGLNGWKEMSQTLRQPYIQAFRAAKKRRGQILAILRKKAALTVCLTQLDTDLEKLQKAVSVSKVQPTDPQDQSEAKTTVPAESQSAVPAPGHSTEKRLGWRTVKAMRRYRKVMLEGLPEGSEVTKEEVLKGWKSLSYSQKQPYFARKGV